jgi:hypothetical protein
MRANAPEWEPGRRVTLEALLSDFAPPSPASGRRNVGALPRKVSSCQTEVWDDAAERCQSRTGRVPRTLYSEESHLCRALACRGHPEVTRMFPGLSPHAPVAPDAVAPAWMDRLEFVSGIAKMRITSGQGKIVTGRFGTATGPGFLRRWTRRCGC